MSQDGDKPLAPHKPHSLRDSPFHDMLHRIHTPTESELQQIRDICANSVGAIENSKAEVQRLQKLLEQAERERDELEMLYSCHAALLSPVHRISVELLQLIFSFCLPEDRNPVMSASDAPLLIARVCSRWRAVALDTPQLWTSVHAVIPSIYDRTHASRRLQAFKDWISRSGECPLSISLYLSLPEERKVTIAFLQALVSVSHRWADIMLLIPLEYVHQLDILSSPEHPPLLQLRSFELTTSFHPPITESLGPYGNVLSGNTLPQPEALQFLSYAPSLSDLRVGLGLWQRVGENIPELLPPINTISNLEHLILGYPLMFAGSAPQFLHPLSQCQKLRKLEILGTQPDSDGEFLSSESRSIRVILPMLESFKGSITMSYGHAWQAMETRRGAILHLLDHLVTPNLKQLHLSSVDTIANPAIAITLTEFFSRSAPCPLEVLELSISDGDRNSAEKIVASLQLVPCIRRLVINMPQKNTLYHHWLNSPNNSTTTEGQEPIIMADLLNELTPDGTGDSKNALYHCPNLEELVLISCNQESKYDSLVPFLKSRVGNNNNNFEVQTPLKLVKMEWTTRAPIRTRNGPGLTSHRPWHWHVGYDSEFDEVCSEEEERDGEEDSLREVPSRPLASKSHIGIPDNIRSALEEIVRAQAPDLTLVFPSPPVAESLERPDRSPWCGMRTVQGITWA